MNSSAKKYIYQSNIITQRSISNSRVTPENQPLEDNISNSINQITSIEIEKKQEPVSKKISTAIESFLESKKVTITMSFITVYTLFADDVKTLTCPKSVDDIFSSIVVICLILFSFELILSFIFKPSYKWSFYFWLDFIATLTLVTDIEWIWDQLIGVSNSSSKNKQLQNAGQASRAGTRSSRLLRIIRLIRLIRLVKLYKNAQIALKNNAEEEDLPNDFENVTSESKVGKKLSEVTMKRVIMIVLILLLIVPFFEDSFYLTPQTSWDFGTSQLSQFVLTENIWDDVKDEFIEYHISDIRPLVYLTWTNDTGSFEWRNGISYNDLRYNEIYYASYTNVIAIFDLRYDAKLTSTLNIVKTLFICIVLSLGSLYFTKDAENLLIRPIEKIIAKVRRIGVNPLAVSEIKTIHEHSEFPTQKICFCIKAKIQNQAAYYETKTIENTFLKIGILLALGFGEAGSSIICSNMNKDSEIKAILEGTKIVGIFGFCDIRNFTDTTEELQEGVMMFVNEIAQIIHGLVDKYHGTANKNIGDAFLLVWKFSKEEFYFHEDILFRSPDQRRSFYLPDLSLLSFLKIIAKVNKDSAILKYRNNLKLTQRMPGFEVKMGFGLHLGWAIEGAIGTYFKLDASYLSPHVNLASSLEALTKLYGIPLLLSGSLFDVLSKKVQKYCRKIDYIRIKGMPYPLNIYTFDLDPANIELGKVANRGKKLYRSKKKTIRRKLENQQLESSELFEKSKEIQNMRKNITSEFLSTFEKAVEKYLSGDWLEAKLLLKSCIEMRNHDGPAEAILKYIEEFSCCCPCDWEMSRFIS